MRQEGHIFELRDHLFACFWDSDAATIAAEAQLVATRHAQIFAYHTLAKFFATPQQGHAPVAHLETPDLPPPGKKLLKKGGYRWPNKHYPFMPREPRGCCRGWYADGVCNDAGGIEACGYNHYQEQHRLGELYARPRPAGPALPAPPA